MSQLENTLKTHLAAYLAELDVIQGQVLDRLNQWQIEVAQPDSLHSRNPGSRERPAIEGLRKLVARREELLKLAQSNGIAVTTLRELAARLDDSEKSLSKSAALMKRKMERVHYASLGHWISCQKAWLHYSDLVQLIATGGRKSLMPGNTSALAQGGVILDAKV